MQENGYYYFSAKQTMCCRQQEKKGYGILKKLPSLLDSTHKTQRVMFCEPTLLQYLQYYNSVCKKKLPTQNVCNFLTFVCFS